MSMLSCWGYCILCFEDSTLVELAFPCFIWGNESKVCLGLVNFCSAGQNIDFIWLNCCKKTISEYIRTTRKEPIKQTCNIPTTWRTWKKHRAKIGHDLYIYTVDLSIFFCRAKIWHAESLSMAQMGQGVEPSERIVTGGHGFLPSPLSGHGSRVRVIGAPPSYWGNPIQKKTHGKILDHLNFKPPKMAILKGNIIFQHHFVGVPCWFLRS